MKLGSSKYQILGMNLMLGGFPRISVAGDSWWWDYLARKSTRRSDWID